MTESLEVFCFHKCIYCRKTKIIGVKDPYPKGWYYDDDAEDPDDDGFSDVCPDCCAERGIILCDDCGGRLGGDHDEYCP